MQPTPRALLFGSLGVLAEFAELRRRAVNVAFQEAGLAWTWSAAIYAALEDRPDLRQRIADFAALRSERVDAPLLEARASAIFRRMLREVQIPLRPGLRDTIGAARGRGIRLALLTGCSAEEAALVLAAVRPAIGLGSFDHVVHRVAAAGVTAELRGRGRLRVASGLSRSPHADALRALGMSGQEAVAVECHPAGAAAAAAAGIRAVVVPGALHRRRAFPDTAERAEALSPGLLGLAPALQDTRAERGRAASPRALPRRESPLIAGSGA